MVWEQIKEWWKSTCEEVNCNTPAHRDNLTYVCVIPIHWCGVSKVIKGAYDEADEDITVHVYRSGCYKEFQYGFCKRYDKFVKFKHHFEAYKQTKDVAHIQEWITWKQT